jgi:hypothetical protein
MYSKSNSTDMSLAYTRGQEVSQNWEKLHNELEV